MTGQPVHYKMQGRHKENIRKAPGGQHIEYMMSLCFIKHRPAKAGCRLLQSKLADCVHEFIYPGAGVGDPDFSQSSVFQIRYGQ